VAQGRQLILVDTRGHGVSTIGRANFTYQNFAEDVIAVLDQLNISRSDFVGWSDGGNTSLRLAELYPARVDRIILLSANYSPAGLIDPNFSNFNKSWWNTFWWKIRGSGRTELINKVKSLWQNHPKLTPTDLTNINSPTLVIVGEDDEVALHHTRKMVAALPHSTFHLIRNAGHMALMTHAAEFNQVTLSFLNKP
jgi:pimeloyl-ACP methyl ester carboxylesterase